MIRLMDTTLPDLPATIRLAPGEVWTSPPLPELGSAGYLWGVHSNGSGVVGTVVRPSDEQERQRGQAEHLSIGGPGQVRIEIEAFRPGTYAVHLKHQRPWDVCLQPNSNHAMTVVVAEEG